MFLNFHLALKKKKNTFLDHVTSWVSMLMNPEASSSQWDGCLSSC